MAAATSPSQARTFPYELPWAERHELRAALREHPLVLLATPRIGADDLLALGAALGGIEPPLRVNFRHPGHPAIMLVGNLRDEHGRKVAASSVKTGWHADGGYRTHPPEVTLLLAREVPAHGGDTHFTSLHRLHEQLEPATRAAWEGLRVEHEAASTYFDGYEDRVSIHPLIQRHPESGRPLVRAVPAYARRVLGVPEHESRAILDRLAAACDPPDHVHRWRPGDLLAWDNRAVLHRATPHDPDERRELWRVSVYLDRRG